MEEIHQVRGQRRKWTEALIVISTLKPMSDDSWNLPLIVLEALKDILFDFTEARAGRQAWRPMAAISCSSKRWLRVYPRILTCYHLRGYQCVWWHKPHPPFSGRYPPTNVCQLFLDGCQRLLMTVRIVMKVLSQVSTIPGGPEKRKLVLCCSYKRTAAQYLAVYIQILKSLLGSYITVGDTKK